MVVEVDHADLRLSPEAGRTVIRPFSPGYPAGFDQQSRSQRIADMVEANDKPTLDAELARMREILDSQHRDVEKVLLRRFAEINGTSIACNPEPPDMAILVGAYFSEEYSFEAAALFNPTMVLHPDQSGMDDTSFRFVLGLRGMGEGHLSSVTFRTGVWRGDIDVTVDTPSPYSVAPTVMAAETERESGPIELHSGGAQDISETVLFPVRPSQAGGIEDLRLVSFVEDDGTSTYYGTFTAFSGRDIHSELLTTRDFASFTMTPLTGTASVSKGMALFPRKVCGQYVMLGRQDNESLWLHRSDNLLEWNDGEKLLSPAFPWDCVQMGNCGSPIEIDEGWLVVTHGVGPVRGYAIGAALLDKDDPSKVLGRVSEPILRPAPEERDGYVPNVVYSCGALVRGRRLMLPYGVADNYTRFASIALDGLLAALR